MFSDTNGYAPQVMSRPVGMIYLAPPTRPGALEAYTWECPVCRDRLRSSILVGLQCDVVAHEKWHVDNGR